MGEANSSKQLVTAPTLYCIFALGVIFVMIGTFITAHAYVTHHPDNHHKDTRYILKILGPILLGCGSLILLGMSSLCLVMYKKNKRFRNLDSDDLFLVGESTFFDEHLAPPGEWHHKGSSRGNALVIDNTSSLAPDEDPITFLSNVIVHERRKLSKKYKEPSLADSTKLDYTPESEIQPKELLETNQRYFGMQELHRSTDWDNLTIGNGFSNQYSLKVHHPNTKTRTKSMSAQRPQFREDLDPGGLRRVASVTPSAREERKRELKKRQENLRLKIEMEKQQFPPEWVSLSLRKKPKRGETPPYQPIIHQLPSYSSEIINNLIQVAEKKNYGRTVSFDPNQAEFIETPLKVKGEFMDNYNPSLSNEPHNVNYYDAYYAANKYKSNFTVKSSSSDEETTQSLKRRTTKRKKMKSKAKVNNESLKKKNSESPKIISRLTNEDSRERQSYTPDFMGSIKKSRSNAVKINSQLEDYFGNGSVVMETHDMSIKAEFGVENETNGNGGSSKEQHRIETSSIPSPERSSSHSPASPSPPPSLQPPLAKHASIEAAEIMRDLMTQNHPGDRVPLRKLTAKRLSVISSQTETCDSEEEKRRRSRSEVESKIKKIDTDTSS